MSILITICILLLFAYIFDITSSKTKIPSVILLLVLGWAVGYGSKALVLEIPDLTPILPIIGTIGLVLIVLEGSLELELNRSKLPFVWKTTVMSLAPMLILSFILAYAFMYFGFVDLKMALANSIPFAIISSAIAIPSAHNLAPSNKDFITYESSLSDIFGVIFFNFITLNGIITIQSVGVFLVQMIFILIITFIATIGLAFLLSKIKQHVKFAPIILMIVLIYAISKIYHLPGLIFILLFGLFLGNLDELKQIKFIEKLQPDILRREVLKFKELNMEIVFLIRSLFFLLFGYLIETTELLNTGTIQWALLITVGIFLLRFLFLKIFKLPIQPLLFIAPRGLITILLFLSIPLSQMIDLNNKSLIIQVIILTALVMMVGLIQYKKVDPQTTEP